MATCRPEGSITATLGTSRAEARHPALGTTGQMLQQLPSYVQKEELGETGVHRSFFHLGFLEPPVIQIKNTGEGATVYVHNLQDTEHDRW